MISLKQIVKNFKGKKILVIGDVILDQHIRGTVSRISPEAPVPVVLQKGSPTFAPGGAANVAANLKALGARVTLVGRIGQDAEGKIFLKCLGSKKIPAAGIITDKTIPTIVKTRIMAQHQQVVRVDREAPVKEEDARLVKRVLSVVAKKIEKTDAVIISDYGKGLISRALIEELCRLAHRHGKIVTVDPKVEHFAFYQKVTGITPNRKEAENAIRNIKITHSGRKKLALNSDRLDTYADVERAARQLLKFLDLESLMITLGEQGMCLLEKGKPPAHIQTRAKDVFDVTGAGDTVISVFTLALTAGATKRQAADLANDAAGIVVGQMGAVSVSAEELAAALKHH